MAFEPINKDKMRLLQKEKKRLERIYVKQKIVKNAFEKVLDDKYSEYLKWFYGICYHDRASVYPTHVL